jgi:hypothetical protein
VAVHAGRARRDVGVPGLLHPVMAVAAIHAQLVHVHGVRKGHRLDRLIPHPGILGRQVIPHPRRQRGGSQQPADEDHPRQPISPLWEYRRHFSRLFLPRQVSATTNMDSPRQTTSVPQSGFALPAQISSPGFPAPQGAEVTFLTISRQVIVTIRQPLGERTLPSMLPDNVVRRFPQALGKPWGGLVVALWWLCTPESMPSICLVYAFRVALGGQRPREAMRFCKDERKR